MSTQAQQQASRQNGQKSLGPVSGEGKKIAARNATKHGLASTDPNPETLLLAHENPVDLARMQSDYYRRYAPADTVERDLVDRLIAAQWRLRRARLMETLVLESDRFEEDPDTGETVDLGFAYAFKKNFQEWKAIQRYEARQTREASNAIKELRALRGQGEPTRAEIDRIDAELLSVIMAPLPGEDTASRQDALLNENETKNYQTNPRTPIFHPDNIQGRFHKTHPKPKR